jgi:hypothetical protein
VSDYQVPTALTLADCNAEPGIVEVFAHDDRRDREKRKLEPRGFGPGYTLVCPAVAGYVNSGFDTSVLEAAVGSAPANLRDDYRRLVFNLAAHAKRARPTSAGTGPQLTLVTPDGLPWVRVQIDLTLTFDDLREEWYAVNLSRTRWSKRRRAAIEAVLAKALQANPSITTRTGWIAEPRWKLVGQLDLSDQRIEDVATQLVELSRRFQAAWPD